MNISGALAILLAILAGGPAVAQVATVDYVGFAWETGGFPASEPGDVLSVATVVTQIDPLFEVDLGAGEGTLFIEGLVSQGAQIDSGNGFTTITYSGGTIAVYADAAANHDWGINPANGTVPSTFVDGELVFAGEFSFFTLTVAPTGAGAFEGLINATGGSAVAGPCSNCAYSFAGTFAAPTGAQIPEGYDLQVDGMLEVEAAVPVSDASWSEIKQLYNPSR